MTVLQRLSDWIVDRQEQNAVRKMAGSELTGGGVPLAAFMSAFNMPEDTRTRMEAMAENYGLPRDVLETEHGRALVMARACGSCRERGRCARWLDGEETGIGPDAFCPNADHWSALAQKYPPKVQGSTTEDNETKAD